MSCACAAGTLPTEPSPRPMMNILHIVYLHELMCLINCTHHEMMGLKEHVHFNYALYNHSNNQNDH